jgi:hypothetical protein
MQTMSPSFAAIADLVGLLDENLREAFEERAGIIEFDANTPRDLAECLALLDVLRRHPGALLGVTALQVDLSYVLATTSAAVPHGAIPVTDLARVITETFGGIAVLTKRTAGIRASYVEGLSALHPSTTTTKGI